MDEIIKTEKPEVSLTTFLARLTEAKQIAVKLQNYELAAVLRDAINKYEYKRTVFNLTSRSIKSQRHWEAENIEVSEQ